MLLRLSGSGPDGLVNSGHNWLVIAMTRTSESYVDDWAGGFEALSESLKRFGLLFGQPHNNAGAGHLATLRFRDGGNLVRKPDQRTCQFSVRPLNVAPQFQDALIC
jgi:hypothetical protein